MLLVHAVLQPTCAVTLIHNVMHLPLSCPLLFPKVVSEQGIAYATLFVFVLFRVIAFACITMHFLSLHQTMIKPEGLLDSAASYSSPGVICRHLEPHELEPYAPALQHQQYSFDGVPSCL